MRRALLLTGPALLAACAGGPHPRTQHVVNGEVVSSRPPAPSEYAAYVRVRVALETPGADLVPVRRDLDALAARNPNEPLVWVARAKLEYLSGDKVAAERALARALVLRPDYEPALALRVTISGEGQEAI